MHTCDTGRLELGLLYVQTLFCSKYSYQALVLKYNVLELIFAVKSEYAVKEEYTVCIVPGTCMHTRSAVSIHQAID